MNYITILHKLLDRAYASAHLKRVKAHGRAVEKRLHALDAITDLCDQIEIQHTVVLDSDAEALSHLEQGNTIDAQRRKAAELFGGV